MLGLSHSLQLAQSLPTSSHFILQVSDDSLEDLL